jgi:hypothetical protein
MQSELYEHNVMKCSAGTITFPWNDALAALMSWGRFELTNCTLFVMTTGM